MSAITNAKGGILERVKADSKSTHPERSLKIRGRSIQGRAVAVSDSKRTLAGGCRPCSSFGDPGALLV
jgi:hypothetical protein